MVLKIKIYILMWSLEIKKINKITEKRRIKKIERTTF